MAAAAKHVRVWDLCRPGVVEPRGAPLGSGAAAEFWEWWAHRGPRTRPLAGGLSLRIPDGGTAVKECKFQNIAWGLAELWCCAETHCPALCAPLPPGPADHPVTGQSQAPGVLLGSRVGGGLGEVPAASEPVLITRPWPHLVGRSGLTHPPSVS